jgi:hypothetical protein
VPSDAALDGGDAAVLYLGCFADSETRDLPHPAWQNNSFNTTEACIAACATHAYAYAGTQSGYQCWCGNSYGGQGPANGCTYPCSGALSEICGGGYQNSVYATMAPPPPPKYVGCFTDSQTRDLPSQAYSNGENTVENCVADCAYHWWLYAGVQSGNECWCGNSSGKASEKCGGIWQNSVYRTGSQGDAGGPSDAASQSDADARTD